MRASHKTLTHIHTYTYTYTYIYTLITHKYSDIHADTHTYTQATRALEDSKVKSIGLGGHVDIGALREKARKAEVKYAGKEGMVHYHRCVLYFAS